MIRHRASRLRSTYRRHRGDKPIRRAGFEELADAAMTGGGDRNANQIVRRGRVYTTDPIDIRPHDVIDVAGEAWKVRIARSITRPEDGRLIGQIVDVTRRTPGARSEARP